MLRHRIYLFFVLPTYVVSLRAVILPERQVIQIDHGDVNPRVAKFHPARPFPIVRYFPGREYCPRTYAIEPGRIQSRQARILSRKTAWRMAHRA